MKQQIMGAAFVGVGTIAASLVLNAVAPSLLAGLGMLAIGVVAALGYVVSKKVFK